jgi:hypothetical protein
MYRLLLLLLNRGLHHGQQRAGTDKYFHFLDEWLSRSMHGEMSHGVAKNNHAAVKSCYQRCWCQHRHKHQKHTKRAVHGSNPARRSPLLEHIVFAGFRFPFVIRV